MKAIHTCYAVWAASLLAVSPAGAGLHDDSSGVHPMAFASWSTGELRLVDATLRVPDLLAPEIQYLSLSMLGTLDASWVFLPPMVAVVLPKVELWADPDAEVIALTKSVTRLHFGVPVRRDVREWRRDRGGRFLDPWKIDQSPRTGLGKFR